MDVLRRRQWGAIRHAIRGVLDRWHPEAFAPPGHDHPGLDSTIVGIYALIEKWMDPDILVAHLCSLERQSPDLRTSDDRRLRAVADELLAIDFEAILEHEGRLDPPAPE